MLNGHKIVVVLPAYNAAETLERTYNDIPHDLVDEIILVDDASKDHTVSIAKELGIKHILRHKKNTGYGGNQKSCYNIALSLEADIVIMLHPDYQYNPKLIGAMAYMISSGAYPVVFASRLLGKGTLEGGMPLYKYVANRFLTAFQNLFINQNLSEYHTGYRAYHANVLRNIGYTKNSDNFIFDNQVILQIVHKGYKIGEISCPTRYFEDASSINLSNSIRYGWGILVGTMRYRLHKLGMKWDILS
jgi:glycosyltransferase involved in cell wall biosynthesis